MNSHKNKKPDKTKSVKFLLAPRPQKDPLTADYEAPQHVLVPKNGTDIDQIRERLPDLDPKVFASKDETKIGMLERAYNADGLTFDPDLLQAMSKDFDYEDANNILDDDFMDQAGGLIEDEGEILDGEMTDLAAELFEDEPEVIVFDQGKDDDECLYDSDDYNVDQDIAKTKSQPDWQDIDEGDDLFGYGKRLILFKKKANKSSAVTSKTAQSAQQLQEELNVKFKPVAQRLMSSKNKPQVRDYNNEDEGEEDDIYCVDDDDHDDAKTVFTNYSMTSSVMRRSEGLQQIDEHFERLYEKEYADDTEIGPLDLNEVKGVELLTNIDQIRQLKREIKAVRKRNHGDDYEPEIVSEHYKAAIIGNDPTGEDEDLVEIEIRQHENRVDCESILTYNSNLHNHPKLIVETRKRSTSHNNSDQMEVDDSEIRSRSGRAQSIASSRATVLSKLSVRPSNETPEERKARKKSLKEYRHDRRIERKQNQQIFKSEQANLVKQQRTNLPALKLT